MCGLNRVYSGTEKPLRLAFNNVCNSFEDCFQISIINVFPKVGDIVAAIVTRTKNCNMQGGECIHI